MAYAATSSVVQTVISGRRHWLVTVTETEAAATSEWSVGNLPSVGTIVLFQATLTTGTATTIKPKLGKATSWTASTNNVIGSQSAAAAHIHDVTELKYAMTGNTLFGCSVVSASDDNAVSTFFVIREGV